MKRQDKTQVGDKLQLTFLDNPKQEKPAISRTEKGKICFQYEKAEIKAKVGERWECIAILVYDSYIIVEAKKQI